MNLKLPNIGNTLPVEDFGKVHHRGRINFHMHLSLGDFLIRFITGGVNILFKSAE